VIRSTAGTLVAAGLLLFVVPPFAFFLPAPWDDRVAAVMLPNLAPQLTGTAEVAVLSPVGAVLAMAYGPTGGRTSSGSARSARRT
jgi:ABC-2 type transport system permease protein